jgi:hypothetical protein
MQDSASVSPASDLFSVCAIFYEYLRGEPMRFAALYSGERITSEQLPLINGVPKAVAGKALAVIKKGLRLAPSRRYQSAAELKLDFLDLLQELSYLKNKRHAVTAACVFFAVLLTVAFMAFFGFFTASYPNTKNEIYATGNAMTALGDSLARLGLLINADLRYLEGGAPAPDIADANAAWSSGEIIKTLGPRSPIPAAQLSALLDAPVEYAAWSERMREKTADLSTDESPYSETIRNEVSALCKKYVDVYANICFIQLELTVLPLNADGKKTILDMLPYTLTFSEIFLENPFITDKSVLESALEAERLRIADIAGELKAYGF